jgi:hypothetical protein
MDISPHSKLEVYRDKHKGIYIQVSSNLELHNISQEFKSPSTYYRGRVSESENFYIPATYTESSWDEHFTNFLASIIDKVRLLEKIELEQIAHLNLAQRILAKYEVNAESDHVPELKVPY